MKYPPMYKTPHIYTHTYIQLRSTPTLHYSCQLRRRIKIYGLQDRHIYIFKPLNISIHTLAYPLPSTKLKLHVLREASKYLLRKCAHKNDCFSQRRGKQQVTGVTAILVCDRFLPSSPRLPIYLYFFPPNISQGIKKFLSWTSPTNALDPFFFFKFQWFNNTQDNKTTGQRNEKLPDD